MLKSQREESQKQKNARFFPSLFQNLPPQSEKIAERRKIVLQDARTKNIRIGSNTDHLSL